MIADCASFERWLDEGLPGSGAAEARAHAERCPRCARALAAAQALEEALARPLATTAPADFTDAVMRRVGEARHAQAAARLLPLPPAFAWWVRAAADPLVALSLVLTGLIAWRHDALWAFAGALASRLSASVVAVRLPGETVLTLAAPRGLHAFADPTVLLGLMLALVPAALWSAWWLFRWSERVIQPFARHASR